MSHSRSPLKDYSKEYCIANLRRMNPAKALSIGLQCPYDSHGKEPQADSASYGTRGAKPKTAELA